MIVDLFSPAIVAAVTGILDTPSPFLSRISAEPFLGARERYDIDLPADAVRELRAVVALQAPVNEADSDGGECD
ncbi:hypothetical protein [Burkholderia cepacia]|uniref:hypothetical protein n=1 Tax=Burkholderia cepacia TaxID=292 RepID=UPI001CF5ABB9|nr:hypothetical protein [Burkholderia cepacia]MCA8323267.1 hypothetical protein [Burkholderia cepacia]MCA8326183.1 hypothetical protein [Burkholderia cepacia]